MPGVELYKVEWSTSLNGPWTPGWESRGEPVVVDIKGIPHDRVFLRVSTATTSDYHKNVAAAGTGDSSVPFVARHANGEQLMVLVDPDNPTTVTGAVWIASDGSNAVVHCDSEGKPLIAVWNNSIYLFSNYTSNSVDLAEVCPDGSCTIIREVHLPAQALNARAHTKSRSTPHTEEGLLDYTELRNALQVAAVAVATFGCVSAIIASSGIAIPCAVAVVTSISLLTPDDDPALAGTGAFLDTTACIKGNGASCVGVALAVADAFSALADSTVEAQVDLVSMTQHSLQNTNQGYRFVPGDYSWNAARQAASQRGGHLATITSARENQIVAALLLNAGANQAWIGGSDSVEEGEWNWVTGEAWSFTAWRPNQPDGGTFQSYLTIDAGSGQWDDKELDNPNPKGFVME
jgi:hypothetical protein